jgi:hypothetical protein
MTTNGHTRRRVLKSTGAVLGAAVLGSTPAAAGNHEEWTVEETPTGDTLYGVNYTTDGAYAVGAGGVVIERTEEGWKKALDGGPTGNGNSLYGSDVIDDGSVLWFAGSSGAIGEYDVESGVLTDHSAPNDVTNNFNGIDVRGESGSANVYVAGDSGKIYYSFDDGETGSWGSVTPGSGSNINALDFFGPRSGHAVDGNKTVFVTDDGSTYDELGIADANEDFYGVDSDGDADVTVVGGGGTVYEWDGSRWTRTDLGDASLRDVEVSRDEAYTVGGGGKVFRRSGGTWSQEATPTGQNLKAVVDGPTPLAVGAGGTVIARK